MTTTTTTVFLAGNTLDKKMFQVPANMYEHNIAVTVETSNPALNVSATIGTAVSGAKTQFHCLSATGDKDTTVALVPHGGSNTLFYISNPHPHAAGLLNLFGNTPHEENGFALFVAHGTEANDIYTFDLSKSKVFKPSIENASTSELVCVTGHVDVIAALITASEHFAKDGDHPIVATIDSSHAVLTIANLVRLTSLATALSATSIHSTIIVSIQNLEKDGATAKITVEYKEKDPKFKHEHSLVTLLHSIHITKNTFTISTDNMDEIAPKKTQSDDDDQNLDHIVTFSGDVSRITIVPPKMSELTKNGAALQPTPIAAKIPHSAIGKYLTERHDAFSAMTSMCGHYFSHLADKIKSL